MKDLCLARGRELFAGVGKKKRLAVQGVNVLRSKQWTHEHLFHFWTSTCCFGGALILLLLYCHYCWFTLNAVGGHSNQERIHKGIFLTSHTNKKQDWKRERVCVSERERERVCVCVSGVRERERSKCYFYLRATLVTLFAWLLCLWIWANLFQSE